MSCQINTPRRPLVGVVTVTHGGAQFFEEYIRALASQTFPPDLVVIVDAASPDSSFLDRTETCGLSVKILLQSNLGFAAASNLGWSHIRHMDYVLFLNPDAFPAPTLLERGVAYMAAHPAVGIVTPSLERYDIQNKKPLGIIDTTGVIRKYTGQFTERDEGQPIAQLARYDAPNEVPWVCAATMLCRRQALEAVAQPGKEPFSEDFFMYKEDTDLAWRVRRAGWKLIHHPDLYGYHCRGWQNRRSMSRRMRLMTARNEVMMSLTNRSPFVLVALAKLLIVWALNV